MKQKIKLAIVDDHPLLRKGLISLFSNAETFEIVIVASNGKELINSLPEKMPHVLILDLEMPEMDGIEVTDHLHKNYPEIKILILSMHDDDSFIIHLIEKGARGYLPKNGDEQIILGAVLSIMEVGYYFDEGVNRVLIERFLEGNKIKPIFKQVSLSEREIEVIKLICNEFTYEEIAQKLFISLKTVKRHRDNMMEKVGARNTIGLVMFAVKNNLHSKSIRNAANGIKRL